ncbi:hypothetical protein [Streptomyces sp. NPDC088183]|uniref:hypothetical protein n=1 Tax=Streptomyces sp. NPDC088183 TaxID=3160992 RepID=UPI00342B8509
MAKAFATEEIVRTVAVTLTLSSEEARALSSLAQHARAEGDDGPGQRIERIAEELRRVVRDELPAVPRDQIFSADGVVTFSAYRTSY